MVYHQGTTSCTTLACCMGSEHTILNPKKHPMKLLGYQTLCLHSTPFTLNSHPQGVKGNAGFPMLLSCDNSPEYHAAVVVTTQKDRHCHFEHPKWSRNNFGKNIFFHPGDSAGPTIGSYHAQPGLPSSSTK